MAKTRTNKNPIPLIIEDHPDDYDGYPFITLIQYDDTHFLTIVDNATDKLIRAYVLDLCGPESVNEELLIETAGEWYSNNRDRFPISFEFSRRNLTAGTEKILKTFQLEFVPRVIGPLPKFDFATQPKIRKRRKKALAASIEIKKKVIDFP